MKNPYKILIGGKWVKTSETFDVVNPYNGRLVSKVYRALQSDVDMAIGSAVEAFKVTRKMSANATSRLLKRIVHGLIKHKSRLADSIVAEAGKPIDLANAEVDRTIMTFNIASEEVNRMAGEMIPVDIDKRGEGRYAIVKRFPIGVVAGISPFNFPLNLVSHKVAPVIASRNTIVLKPASKTPITALILGEVLTEAGITPGQYNVVPCRPDAGEALVSDDRVAKLTFTGSPAVGWRLKKIANQKKVTLELGGNAAAVICKDSDIDWAVNRVTLGAFAFAGQVCISVQRILIEKSIFDKTVRKLVKATKENIKIGDPRKPGIMVGPMVDTKSLKRTGEWVDDAVAAGAKVLTGGKAKGRCYEPTILSNVTKKMNVVCKEAFAPVVVVQPFNNFKQAIDMVNDSDYGLQVGVFTKDIDKAFHAFEEAHVGGVIVNDFPTFRVDNMPYGGVKMSGFGREGIQYAIEEMTERKVMVIKR